MDHLLIIKLIAALFILCVSLLAGIPLLRSTKTHQDHPFLEYGEAIGGGIFLGIALFHMLPEAETNFRLAYGDTHYPFANLICAFGFVLLLFLEKVIFRITEQQPTHKHNLIPYVLPLVLIIHAIIEGAALGINTTLANVSMIFIAIIVHKSSESFALAAHLGRSQLSLPTSSSLFLIWAITSPLGVLGGSYLATQLQSHNGMIYAAIFNAFAAGTFLYIATLHKTTHLCSHKHTDHFIEFLLFLLGLGAMAVVETCL